MKKRSKLLAGALLLSAGLLLASCSDNKESSNSIESPKSVIKIGTTVGDFADMVTEFIQPELDKKGYEVRLVEFTDYVLPNRALADGSIDINVFQHLPYLTSFRELNKLDIVEVFQTPTGPLGIYSGKKSDADNIEEGTTVAVANDPSNYARTLLLLSQKGWLTLKEGVDPLKATRQDIATNPFNIKLIELEAPQLPRARQDVDFVVIPGNYAASSGISFNEALFKEPGYTFINWAAVKREDLGKEWLKDVEETYNSDGFKAYAKERFSGYKYPEKWGEALPK